MTKEQLLARIRDHLEAKAAFMAAKDRYLRSVEAYQDALVELEAEASAEPRQNRPGLFLVPDVGSD